MNRDRSAPEVLGQEEKVELVERISKVLGEKYVYPEIAEKMIAFVEGKMAAGEYGQARTGLEFAEALTSDLQEISQDRHLHVVYDPRRAEQLQKSPGRKDETDQRQIRGKHCKIQALPQFRAGTCRSDRFIRRAVPHRIRKAVCSGDDVPLDRKGNHGRCTPSHHPKDPHHFIQERWFERKKVDGCLSRIYDGCEFPFLG